MMHAGERRGDGGISYVAVLDNLTCTSCAALHGRLDVAAPNQTCANILTAIGCRCRTVPDLAVVGQTAMQDDAVLRGLEMTGVADARRVFDLLEDLRRAWERILNSYHDDVRFVDAMMAVHNFHKLALQNIANDAGLWSHARGDFYRGAAATFQLAMETDAKRAEVGA